MLATRDKLTDGEGNGGGGGENANKSVARGFKVFCFQIEFKKKMCSTVLLFFHIINDQLLGKVVARFVVRRNLCSLPLRLLFLFPFASSVCARACVRACVHA